MRIISFGREDGHCRGRALEEEPSPSLTPESLSCFVAGIFPTFSDGGKYHLIAHNLTLLQPDDHEQQLQQTTDLKRTLTVFVPELRAESALPLHPNLESSVAASGRARTYRTLFGDRAISVWHKKRPETLLLAEESL